MDWIADRILREIYNQGTSQAANFAIDRYVPPERRQLVRRFVRWARRTHLSYDQFKSTVSSAYQGWNSAHGNVERKLRGDKTFQPTKEEPKQIEDKSNTTTEMEPATKTMKTNDGRSLATFSGTAGEEAYGGESNHMPIYIFPQSQRSMRRYISKGAISFTGWSNAQTNGSFGSSTPYYVSSAVTRYAFIWNNSFFSLRGSRSEAYDAVRVVKSQLTLLPFPKTSTIGQSSDVGLDCFLETCNDWDHIKGTITNRIALATGVTGSYSTNTTMEENSTYEIKKIGNACTTLDFPMTLRTSDADMTSVSRIVRDGNPIYDNAQADNITTGCLVTRLIVNNNSVGVDLETSSNTIYWPCILQHTVIYENHI